MKGKFQLILFGLESATNRTKWDFPPVDLNHSGECRFWGGTRAVLGVEIGNAFLEKVGSGLVVQRFPFGWMV